MDVEFHAKIFSAHRGAFDMPAGEPFAPGALPAHDMFGRRGLPEGEVLPVTFLLLAFEVAGGLEEVVEDAAAQFTIGIVGRIFLDVEIDRAIDDVRITFFDDLFDHDDLFDNVTSGGRL